MYRIRDHYQFYQFSQNYLYKSYYLLQQKTTILAQAQMVSRSRNQLKQQLSLSCNVHKRLQIHAYMQLKYFFLFHKTYDVINHDILLDKLNYYGIRAITKLLFISHLAHREQFVEINETGCRKTIHNKYISSYRQIKHAVPPILFYCT